jgi:hypothetical protein
MKLALFWLAMSIVTLTVAVMNVGLRRDLAACRAQCAAAVSGWEGAIKLNRSCLADLQDASDVLRIASGRPLAAHSGEVYAQGGAR